MEKLIVWADSRKDEAVQVDGLDYPEATEWAADKFGVTADAVNIVNEAQAHFYGVSHAIRGDA